MCSLLADTKCRLLCILLSCLLERVWLSMAAHVCNTPTHEAEAEGLRVQGQPTLRGCGAFKSLGSDTWIPGKAMGFSECAASAAVPCSQAVGEEAASLWLLSLLRVLNRGNK